jgi:hypothetical protein
MILLGDEAQVESCFGPIGDGVSISAREVDGWRGMYHRLGNHFGSTRWYSYVTRLKWKLVLVRLETVPILTQDRCTVCAERTIGSIWTHTVELLGDVGHVESCFGPFEDGVSVPAR